MPIIQLCFQGSARYSELAPEYPVANKELVADLLWCPVHELPFYATIDRIKIVYLYPQNLYTICIDFFLHADTDSEEAELLLEGLVGNGLLQIFSKISFVDDPNL